MNLPEHLIDFLDQQAIKHRRSRQAHLAYMLEWQLLDEQAEDRKIKDA